MSKGSNPRPFVVSNQEYESRWDAIFGKDKSEPILEHLESTRVPTPTTNAEKSFIGGWFIDPDLCDRFIEHFEASDKKGPGRTGNGVDKRIKDSIEIDLDINVPIVKEYVEALQLVTTQYINMYPECARTHRWEVSSANIQKYDPGGGFYLWHSERTSIDPVVVARHLVFMTYLNDVTDAGETEFYHQKLKVKPQKGLTLIWPVDWTHTHRGVPSPTQTKYIVTGWFVFIE